MSSKDELFSRNDVCLYTKLSLRQIEVLIAKEVIVPQKNPIRFTYNQLIYCGLFSLIREKFSWDDSVNYLNYCIRSIEKGIPSDIITIYPGYGTIHTGYAKQDDINKIVDEGILTKTVINQKVDLLLLPTKERIINNIIEYYSDEIIIEEIFVIYLVNLIASFRIKAGRSSKVKLTTMPNINLGNCVV